MKWYTSASIERTSPSTADYRNDVSKGDEKPLGRYGILFSEVSCDAGAFIHLEDRMGKQSNPNSV